MFENIICRVCACTDTTLDLVNIFEKQEETECIADMLLELAAVKATLEDGCPQQCCSQCLTDLVQAVAVRRKCIESEKLILATCESAVGLTDEQIDNQSDNVSIASLKHDATCSAEDGTYCCNECSLEFSDSNDLKKHYDAKHANVIYNWESFGISQISLFDSSDEEMQEQDEWTVHRNAAQVLHPTQVPQTFRCCGCNLIFDTDADLKQHSETTHASNALHVDGDYGFQCNVCYKLFTSSSALGNHQNIQYFLRFQCATCGLLFGTQLQLTRHEFKHMRGKFTCDTCDKIFSTPKSLRIHIKRFHTHPETVRAKEKHICSQCGKSLHSAAYLVCHLKLHSKEEPFRCNLCGARFKLVRYLQWHMAKHKQLYQCKQCESSFKSPSELEEHMNRHTGTRAFFCFICGNGFYNKKNLNKHLRMIHSHYKSRKS